MLNIYKASAGSGKTYTLAYEYIKALLGINDLATDGMKLNHPDMNNGIMLHNRHRHILAITFTNKATSEMKTRIIDELVSLSDEHRKSNYASALVDELGCNRTQLAQTAQTALTDILTDYNDFNVTTIDSFFQRVMRTFARELERQGDYSIELADDVAVQNSVEMMLADFNNHPASNKKLGDWIYKFLSGLISEGKKANFFNRKSKLFSGLVDLVANICKESFKPYSDDMRRFMDDSRSIEKFKAELDKRKAVALDELKELTLHTLSRMDADGVDLSHLNGTYRLGPAISEYLMHGREVPNDAIFMKKGNTVDKMLTVGFNVFKGKTPATEVHENLMTELMRSARSQYAYLRILVQMRSSITKLSLLSHAWRYLDRFIVENNIILLSDTNHLLQKIIGKDETPFIYERLGMQLNNFLIDEFQDTSRLQWHNLGPLVSNDIEAHDSLIIGDEKQSIYRWRNSDSSLLHHEVADEFMMRHAPLSIRGAAPGENTNYRSSVEVVGFNNVFFSMLSRELGAAGYGNVVQDIPDRNKDKRGCVRMIPVEADEDALDRMVGHMIIQHDDYGYDWRDIAVLVEKRDEGAMVVDRLIQEGIPVISDESLYLYKSKAVQMVLGVLRLFVNDKKPAKPKENEDGKHYPTPSELNRTICRFEYYRDKGCEINYAIDAALRDEYQVDSEKTTSQSAVAGINAIRKHQPSSLSALVDAIIREELPQDLRNEQMSYLLAFQDFVLDYSTRYIPSVQGLLNAWEKQSGSLSISSGNDVDKVKVMTIHKSKGLEFDCVHIPFGSWDDIGRPSEQWVPMDQFTWSDGATVPPALLLTMNEIYGDCHASAALYRKDRCDRVADQLNKTYVAYTRAVYELNVYYMPDKGMGSRIKNVMGKLDDSMLSAAAGVGIEKRSSEDGSTIIGTAIHKQAEPSKVLTDTTMHIGEYNVSLHTTSDILVTVADEADDEDNNEVSDPKQGYDEYGGDELARLRGISMHRVMSMVVEADDYKRALATVCRSPRLSRDDRKVITDTITGMFGVDSPLVARWYANGVEALNEQPLYDAREDGVRRLDRMVRYPDGSVDVIDYKFTTEEKPEHRQQVSRYAQILHEIDPDAVIRGYLWYPLINNKIVEVETN